MLIYLFSGVIQVTVFNNLEFTMIEDIMKRLEESKSFGGADVIVVPKDWGQEVHIVNADYCGKILEIKKGWSASLHYHSVKDETFLLYNGLLLMEHTKNNWLMYPGHIQRIMPGDVHRFTALKHSRILEFSTHHEDCDTTRLEVGRAVDLKKLEEKYKVPKKRY
jgi:mannose-6-phosphate isomerase-like protein (cupin superfamily)